MTPVILRSYRHHIVVQSQKVVVTLHQVLYRKIVDMALVRAINSCTVK